MRPEISVIIPCHKEAEVIVENLKTLHQYLKERFARYEVIVVVDGSPDGTLEAVESLAHAMPEIPLTLLPFRKNRGKGAAVKTGVLASRYDPILFLDADLTIPITELEKFLLGLETADLAIASRLAPGAHFEEPIPWYRIVLARGFHLLQVLLLGNFEFSDTQCGFKIFRRSVALRLFKKITQPRFAFDAELLFLAKKYNLKVAILPVTIKKDKRNTNVRALFDPVNMFCSLIQIRFNEWTGTYTETP